MSDKPTSPLEQAKKWLQHESECGVSYASTILSHLEEQAREIERLEIENSLLKEGHGNYRFQLASETKARMEAEARIVELERQRDWVRAEGDGARAERDYYKAEYALAVSAMAAILQPGGRLADRRMPALGHSILQEGPGVLADMVEEAETALAETREKLRLVVAAADPFRRVADLNAPLNLPDDCPLHKLMPEAWMQLRELRALKAALDATMEEL